MKKVVLFLSIVVFASCQNNEVQEVETQTEIIQEDTTSVKMIDGYAYYGIKELDQLGAVSVAEMKKMIDSTGSFSGKIKTTLVGVCKKAGCWVTIENPLGDPIRVMFGEHDFFVPIDTPEGKEVVLEGEAILDTTSVEMQKHFLDDAKVAGEQVSKVDYDVITQPLVEISFKASGILIKP